MGVRRRRLTETIQAVRERSRTATADANGRSARSANSARIATGLRLMQSVARVICRRTWHDPSRRQLIGQHRPRREHLTRNG